MMRDMLGAWSVTCWADGVGHAGRLECDLLGAWCVTCGAHRAWDMLGAWRVPAGRMVREAEVR